MKRILILALVFTASVGNRGWGDDEPPISLGAPTGASRPFNEPGIDKLESPEERAKWLEEGDSFEVGALRGEVENQISLGKDIEALWQEIEVKEKKTESDFKRLAVIEEYKKRSPSDEGSTASKPATDRLLTRTSTKVDGKPVFQLPNGMFAVVDGRKSANGDSLVLVKNGEPGTYQVFSAKSVGLEVGPHGSSLSVSSKILKTAVSDQGTTNFVPVFFGTDGKAYDRVLNIKTGMTFRQDGTGWVSSPLSGGEVRPVGKLPSGVALGSRGPEARNQMVLENQTTVFAPKWPPADFRASLAEQAGFLREVSGSHDTLETFLKSIPESVRSPAPVTPGAPPLSQPSFCSGPDCGRRAVPAQKSASSGGSCEIINGVRFCH